MYLYYDENLIRKVLTDSFFFSDKETRWGELAVKGKQIVRETEERYVAEHPYNPENYEEPGDYVWEVYENTRKVLEPVVREYLDKLGTQIYSDAQKHNDPLIDFIMGDMLSALGENDVKSIAEAINEAFTEIYSCDDDLYLNGRKFDKNAEIIA